MIPVFRKLDATGVEHQTRTECYWMFSFLGQRTALEMRQRLYQLTAYDERRTHIGLSLSRLARYVFVKSIIKFNQSESRHARHCKQNSIIPVLPQVALLEARFHQGTYQPVYAELDVPP